MRARACMCVCGGGGGGVVIFPSVGDEGCFDVDGNSTAIFCFDSHYCATHLSHFLHETCLLLSRSRYLLLHHVMSPTGWSYVQGGMGAVSNALASAAVEAGACTR
jgi:hypothetical protein